MTKGQEGLTLVEVLASVVLLTIVLTSIMFLFVQMESMNKMNEGKQQATSISKDILIEWKNKDYGSFFKHPNDFDRIEKDYYVFTTEKNDFPVEIWLKKQPELVNEKEQAHVLIVKVFNERKRPLSELYGYTFVKE